MRLSHLSAFLLAALLASPARAGDTRITVGHSRIEPAEVTVQVGDTVTFHNVDAMPGGHTVSAKDGSFSSPPLDEDESWSHKFETPGRFDIHIEQHPNATGTVTVAE